MSRGQRSLVGLLMAVGLTAAWAQDMQEREGPLMARDVRDMAARGQSFRGAALAGMNLAGLRVLDMDLSGTTWTRADLRGATFVRVNLSGSSMDEINGRGLSLSECSLVGVMLRRADLSGAVFRGCQLSGADLSDCVLQGASFEGCMYSRTGGRHLDAVTVALTRLWQGMGDQPSPLPLSPTLAAGLSGEPFAFVYNSADVRQWPMTPFTESPVRAAVEALGGQLELVLDAAPQKATDTLVRSLQADRVCLLPLSMGSGEMVGTDLALPFWAVVTGLDDPHRPATISLFVPPFGARTLRVADLLKRWEGPWPTLEPAGVERSEARYPLFVITPPPAPPTPREIVLRALRQASRIILDRRTYGTLTPGVAGLRRLSEDLARVGATPDAQLATTLALWEGTPRNCLIAARQQAADFLDELGSLLPESEGVTLTRAAALLRSESRILSTRFPTLKADPGDTLQQMQDRYNSAARLVAELAAMEETAAQVMQQTAEETK